LKRYLIFSIILHIVIIGVALFLIPEKKEREQRPLIARLVTPEETKDIANRVENRISPRKKNSQNHKNTTDRIFAKEKQVPKVLSSVPSSPSAKKSPLGPRALTKELPSRGGRTGQMPDVSGDKGYSEGKNLTGPDKSQIPGQKQAPMREKLFDRDIIAKLSKTEQEGTKKGSAITFDTTEETKSRAHGNIRRMQLEKAFMAILISNLQSRRMANLGLSNWLEHLDIRIWTMPRLRH
jgi:hypothetical protein